MKKTLSNLLYWSTILLMIGYFAYSKGWIFANFNSLDAQEALTQLQKNPQAILLDVRTPQEYQQAHLKGAILFPLSTIQKDISTLKNAKNRPLFVYCHSGNRSVTASRILGNEGFKVFNIRGGIIALKEAHAPLQRP